MALLLYGYRQMISLDLESADVYISRPRSATYLIAMRQVPLFTSFSKSDMAK